MLRKKRVQRKGHVHVTLFSFSFSFFFLGSINNVQANLIHPTRPIEQDNSFADMAKKDKKTEGAVQNREIFQRMNFLYQAAICMAAITTPSSKTSGQDQTTTTEAIDDTKAGSVVHLPEETAKELVQSSLSKSNPARLSRARTRAQFRQNKNRIAKDQISTNTAHQGLTKRNRHHDTHSLSGISRFYAATLREVGRKNVIRMYEATCFLVYQTAISSEHLV